MTRIVRAAMLVQLALVVPVAGGAEPVTFKLHKNYSQASFKSDAPLETFVGVAGKDAVDATITLDPTKPQSTTGTVKVDMNAVRTGIDKRDADMRAKPYLETEIDANRWVTFEIKSVDVAGPLELNKAMPAKVKGILTIKQKSVERVAEANVTYIKLTPEQIEQQKRFGFSGENVKVRSRLSTTFTDHNMQVPQLLFLKVANELLLESDLTFVRAQ